MICKLPNVPAITINRIEWHIIQDYRMMGLFASGNGGGPALTFTQVPDSLVVKCRVAAY